MEGIMGRVECIDGVRVGWCGHVIEGKIMSSVVCERKDWVEADVWRKGSEGKGRKGKGREGKGREGKRKEGKESGRKRNGQTA